MKILLLILITALHLVSFSSLIFAKIEGGEDKTETFTDKGKKVIVIQEDGSEDCEPELYDHYELDTEGRLVYKGKIMMNTCDDEEESPWEK